MSSGFPVETFFFFSKLATKCENLSCQKWIGCSFQGEIHNTATDNKVAWVNQKNVCIQNPQVFIGWILVADWNSKCLSSNVKNWPHICGWRGEIKFSSCWKAGFLSLSSFLLLFPALPSHPGRLSGLEPRATFTSKLANLDVLKLLMKTPWRV